MSQISDSDATIHIYITDRKNQRFFAQVFQHRAEKKSALNDHNFIFEKYLPISFNSRSVLLARETSFSCSSLRT